MSHIDDPINRPKASAELLFLTKLHTLILHETVLQYTEGKCNDRLANCTIRDKSSQSRRSRRWEMIKKKKECFENCLGMIKETKTRLIQ